MIDILTCLKEYIGFGIGHGETKLERQVKNGQTAMKLRVFTGRKKTGIK